jgi:general secretion pathway protein E
MMSQLKSKTEFLEHLHRTGKIDDSSLARTAALSKESLEPLEHIILDLGIIAEPVLADALANFLNIERIASEELFAHVEDESHFPAAFLRNANLILLGVADTHFTVATATPLHDEYVRAMAFQKGRAVTIKVAERTAINSHITAMQKSAQPESYQNNDEVLKREDIERLKDAAKGGPTIKLLSRLVATAIDRVATDIHIEPREDRVTIRLRVDGVMMVIEQLRKEEQLALSSRIKILAAMNIAETRLPQDGRIRIVHKGRPVDLRVATSPVIHGENIVLRILDRQTTSLDLESLGFSLSDANRIGDLTNVANGLFIVTGPTGSGKSTTLYAVLKRLNGGFRKLFSIEDPVEIAVEGVSQIQIKPQIDFDFPQALRAILRQDPDVIMVGEMRDAETAKIAVRASITGHMVLSTLHTNSAVGAISRLRDMGIENYMIAAALKGILAQRLVQKTCSCQGTMRVCKTCSGTGLAGRTVVYELLEANDDFLRAVSKGEDEATLQAIALKQGMMPLTRHAFQQIQRGTVDAMEVKRLGLRSVEF